MWKTTRNDPNSLPPQCRSSLSHSLNPVRVSRTATVRKGHGKGIQSSWFWTKLQKNLFMGQPLCPMTGSSRPWWMKNMFRKNPELIIPSLRWTTWAPTRLHMDFFIKIARLPSWTKNWPMIHFTCDLCRKTEFAPQNPLRPWFRWISSICVLQFLIHSWHRIMPVTIDNRNPTNTWT